MRTAVRQFGLLCVIGAAATLGSTSIASAHNSSGKDGRGEVVKIRMIDRCDPATFNAALGPDACVPPKPFKKPVTFDALLASFDPVEHTASPAWRFKPSDIEIDVGDTLLVTNVGGEPHSFTEVPFFGGGCVDELNDALGLTEVAANCPADFGTVRGPLGTDEIANLSVGTHKFICVIHPWMTATVEVEDDDEVDDEDDED